MVELQVPFAVASLRGQHCPRSPQDHIAGVARQLVEFHPFAFRDMAVEHGLGNADLFTPQFEAALIEMRMRAGAAAR